MKQHWPPVFSPATPILRKPLERTPAPAQTRVVTQGKLPSSAPGVLTAPSAPPHVAVAHASAVQRFVAPSSTIQRQPGGSDQTLQLALRPFLWSGEEPPDDFFAEAEESQTEDQTRSDDTEIDADEDLSSLFDEGSVQAKFATPHPLSSGTIQRAKKQTPLNC